VHKFLSVLVIVAAISGPVALHADSISGNLAAFGDNSFTSSTITFGTAFVSGGPGANTGSFSVLTDGTPIIFRSGVLPYSNGQNTVPPAINPVQLFTTTSAGGEIFSFFMTDYNAQLVSGVTGCTMGTCLDVTGNGFFTGSGPVNYDSSPASFTFTSQELPGQTSTTFSASAIATPSVVPEPSTLALLGSGVIGLAGIVRRRMSRDTTLS